MTWALSLGGCQFEESVLSEVLIYLDGCKRCLFEPSIMTDSIL